jgi:hypothetical protein
MTDMLMIVLPAVSLVFQVAIFYLTLKRRDVK